MVSAFSIGDDTVISCNLNSFLDSGLESGGVSNYRCHCL